MDVDARRQRLRHRLDALARLRHRQPAVRLGRVERPVPGLRDLRRRLRREVRAGRALARLPHAPLGRSRRPRQRRSRPAAPAMPTSPANTTSTDFPTRNAVQAARRRRVRRQAGPRRLRARVVDLPRRRLLRARHTTSPSMPPGAPTRPATPRRWTSPPLRGRRPRVQQRGQRPALPRDVGREVHVLRRPRVLDPVRRRRRRRVRARHRRRPRRTGGRRGLRPRRLRLPGHARRLRPVARSVLQRVVRGAVQRRRHGGRVGDDLRRRGLGRRLGARARRAGPARRRRHDGIAGLPDHPGALDRQCTDERRAVGVHEPERRVRDEARRATARRSCGRPSSAGPATTRPTASTSTREETCSSPGQASTENAFPLKDAFQWEERRQRAVVRRAGLVLRRLLRPPLRGRRAAGRDAAGRRQPRRGQRRGRRARRRRVGRRAGPLARLPHLARVGPARPGGRPLRWRLGRVPRVPRRLPDRDPLEPDTDTEPDSNADSTRPRRRPRLQPPRQRRRPARPRRPRRSRRRPRTRPRRPSPACPSSAR